MNFKHILCPVDFSESCESSLELAFSLARDSNATLHLVHTIHEPHIPLDKDSTGFVPPASDRTVPLQQLEEIKPDGNLTVIRDVLIGPPGASILQYAEENQADLIVMSTHGKTGLTRLLMGSVAEEVVRNGKCPVLTVKQPASSG